MSSLSSFQESSKSCALAAVDKAPETIQNLQTTFQQHFPLETLSATAQKYAATADNLTRNEACAAAIASSQDAADTVLNYMAVIEQYVHLTIPKMEDGNNFGVTVQLAAIKAIDELKEKFEKGLEEVSKYPSQRADALEKCKSLPSTTVTTSNTSSQSKTEGNDQEKGEIKSNENKTSTEEKKTQTVSESPDQKLRQQAVIAVDVLYYSKAKSLYQKAIMGFMMVADFLDKNAEKIDKPKGSGGSGSAYSSMY